MTRFERASSKSQTLPSTADLHPEVVVPIASIPELPRGMQQLSGPNRNNYTTSCAPCQMVPSVPIHICELPTYLEWEQTQEETPSLQGTMESALHA